MSTIAELVEKGTRDTGEPKLNLAEVTVLVDALSPEAVGDQRSQGYVVLSTICTKVRTKYGPEDGTARLTRLFTPFVQGSLLPNESALKRVLILLTALFQVDSQTAISILTSSNAVVTLKQELILKNVPIQLKKALASILGHAAGHALCRSLIASECTPWLEKQCNQGDDLALRATSANALIKLSQQEDKAVSVSSIPGFELAALMQSLVSGTADIHAKAEAIEGLAYASVEPRIRELLSEDPKFLSSLFNFVPRRLSPTVPNAIDGLSSLLYGIAVVTSNLVLSRPQRSQEEIQLEKLRNLANSAQKPKPGAEGEDLEDEKHVRTRVAKVVDAGALVALTNIVKLSDSSATKLVVARSLLSIAESKVHRGEILKAGGAKALMTIIRSSSSNPPSNAGPEILLPIQALAKLAITASPLQVFGAGSDASLDAIAPLCRLLLHESSSSLQQFEAMMALTNIASIGPVTSTHIARFLGLVEKVEILLLDDNVLIRRASCELLCNLISADEQIFRRFGGGDDETFTAAAKSKLQILLALSDVDDTPTRLAASGSLAVVSSSQSASLALISLQEEKGNLVPILLGLLVVDHGEINSTSESEQLAKGLFLRSITCISNLFSFSNEVLRDKILAAFIAGGIHQTLATAVEQYGTSDSTLINPIVQILKSLEMYKKR